MKLYNSYYGGFPSHAASATSLNLLTAACSLCLASSASRRTFTIASPVGRSKYRNAVPCWQVLAESHPLEPVLRGFFDLCLAPSAYQVVT